MAKMTRDLFGYSSPRDLMRWSEQNFADLEKVPDSRQLINCIVLLNHMPDWVWHAWLRTNPERQRQLRLRAVPSGREGERRFKRWVERRCPDAQVLRQLANGAKHLKERRKRVATETGYEVTSLIAIGVPHHERGWYAKWGKRRLTVYWAGASGGSVLHSVLKFWRTFVDQHPGWL